MVLGRLRFGRRIGAVVPSVVCIVGLAWVVGIIGAKSARAGDWPRFRGPTGMGIVEEKGLPTEWDAKGKNIVWKAELPKVDAPWSSPVISGDRIFLTSAIDKAPRSHQVLCFSKSDGKPLWKTEVPLGPWKDGRNNGHATPCTDGKRVYVLFGSAVVAALDFEGHIVWRKELTNYNFDVAIGSSPVLYKDTLLLLCDQNKKTSSLIAFDTATGDIRWEAARPDMAFAHSTPVLAKIGSSEQLLVMVSKGLQGIDPANGKVLWQAASDGDTSSPVYSGNVVYGDGGRGNAGICVEAPTDVPAGAAAPVKLQPKWKGDKLPGDSLGSPIVVGDYLYRHLTGDRLKCFKLATGEEVYTDKLPGTSSRISPIVTPEGNIYFVCGGKSYIIKAGPTFELLAKNDLEDGNDASVAVSDGKLFIRGTKYLWCIGAGGK